MRRALVTTSATAAGVVLLLSLKPHAGAVSTAGAKVISSDPSAAAAEPSPAPSGSATPSTGSAPSTASTGAARTVTGDTVDTRYGPVQVRVALSGKTITRVDVLQYPTQDRRDQEINSYALPQLNQEAISAQSAQIDAVSGATYTSDGYTRSLQSALDKAGA